MGYLSIWKRVRVYDLLSLSDCFPKNNFIFLTKLFKINLFKVHSLGETIRKLREEQGLPLRKVAAYLDIDQAILSKIERGKRNASRDQVVKLADYFKVKENDLLVSWLSDKVIDEVEGESVAWEALQVAEEKLAYKAKPSLDKRGVIDTIRTVLASDGRVSGAWLFGSMSRGDEEPDSDVDLMVEMNTDEDYSFFDLLDIAFKIEQVIHRKIDIVEKGYVKGFAMKSAEKDLIKIYG